MYARTRDHADCMCVCVRAHGVNSNKPYTPHINNELVHRNGLVHVQFVDDQKRFRARRQHFYVFEIQKIPVHIACTLIELLIYLFLLFCLIFTRNGKIVNM